MEEVSLVEPAGAMLGAESGGDRASSSPSDEMYRAQFTSWLGGMGEEARQLAFLLERDEASAPLRRLAADSLNQLLHMADMVPEGTEALGYLETLFTFRLLAAELAEAAFSAPRLPKPRPVKAEPAGGAEIDTQGEGAEAERAAAADVVVGEAGAEAEVAGSEQAEAGPSEDEGAAEAMAAEPLEAAAEMEPSELEPHAEAAQEEHAAESLEAAELDAAESDAAESEAAESEAAESEAAESATAQLEASDPDAAQSEAAQPEELQDEPERAQASDESYVVARRLAPQAALVRAFLGAEDADRLRRLVLEQRSRASRGRSSKEVLLSSEARAAAASEAREWAELYEAPEFGSTQHDLLRLRTFMKTRVRRTTS